ncbi:MAG: bifunctional riboflavin kinase/FAD synthetase [Planctomycetales bacterium]|nr:bifunctional riboflavin kinase/FAD synthetase [Planctomycetales bacterium]
MSVTLYRQLDNLPQTVRGGGLSIGNFDGVHAGHARIIERLVARSRVLGGPAVVFTFDPPPARLLRPQAAPEPLTWLERKTELLGELGVDAVIAYPTDRALLQLSARAFFDLVVTGRLGARAVVEGDNFAFGHNREGSVEMLERLAHEAGIETEVIPAVDMGGEAVSSSRIRRLLLAGDVAEAAHLLTRPYRLRGRVSYGAGRGEGLGFPTANLADVDTLVPAEGVYAALATVDGTAQPAAVNIGGNPTFGETAVKIEAHLIDMRRSLYETTLVLDLLARLRGTERFADPDALRRQITRDIEATRQVCRDHQRG